MLIDTPMARRSNLIIVLADVNDDVAHADIQQFCRAVNLTKMIFLLLHGHMAVPTHQWCSTSINGIFIYVELLPHAKGGFLAFGEATHSNHRAVWVDIPKSWWAFIIQKQSSRLKHDDWNGSTYCTLIQLNFPPTISEHGISQTILDLNLALAATFTKEQQQ